MMTRPRHWLRLDSSVFWVLFGTIALIVLSFWSLDLQLARVLSLESLARMGKFLGELLSPNLEPVFLSKLLRASLETLAMSAVGTLLATIFGLGPFAGTLALALHTTGVLGRLFAESIENSPQNAATALRVQGVGEGRVFLYATLPTVSPQLMSYALYRWENNIRAAAVLGVVGGGGLGQMLSFHMGLFQMQETSSILAAMILLVILVDTLSYFARRLLSR